MTKNIKQIQEWQPIETAPKSDNPDNTILLLTQEKQIVDGNKWGIIFFLNKSKTFIFNTLRVLNRE